MTERCPACECDIPPDAPYCGECAFRFDLFLTEDPGAKKVHDERVQRARALWSERATLKREVERLEKAARELSAGKSKVAKDLSAGEARARDLEQQLSKLAQQNETSNRERRSAEAESRGYAARAETLQREVSASQARCADAERRRGELDVEVTRLRSQVSELAALASIAGASRGPHAPPPPPVIACPRCRTMTPELSTFCSNCGVKIAEVVRSANKRSLSVTFEVLSRKGSLGLHIQIAAWDGADPPVVRVSWHRRQLRQTQLFPLSMEGKRWTGFIAEIQTQDQVWLESEAPVDWSAFIRAQGTDTRVATPAIRYFTGTLQFAEPPQASHG